MSQIADNLIAQRNASSGACGLWTEFERRLGPHSRGLSASCLDTGVASSLSESPGHTPATPTTPAVRLGDQSPEYLPPPATPGATTPRDLSLPAPAGTTPKLKPGRLGHFWTRPRRSHRPEAGLAARRLYRASAARPAAPHRSPAPEAAASEPLTSRLGTRGRRHTLRRRGRGGAYLGVERLQGAGVDGPAPYRPSREGR